MTVRVCRQAALRSQQHKLMVCALPRARITVAARHQHPAAARDLAGNLGVPLRERLLAAVIAPHHAAGTHAGQHQRASQHSCSYCWQLRRLDLKARSRRGLRSARGFACTCAARAMSPIELEATQ